MNERVKTIRKELGLSLDKFGEPLGLKKSALSKVENNINGVSDQLARAICREYNVNEDWFRTGEGDMFVKKTEDEQITEMIEKVMNPNEDYDFQRKFLTALAKLELEDWEFLKKIVNSMIESHDSTDHDEKKEPNHLEVVAAHERTDIEVTDEMKKHDDDLMEDDSNWEN